MSRPSIVQQVTFLRCADLSLSEAFYADLLGFPLVLDQGPCRIYRTAGEAFVGLCTSIDGDVKGEGVILTFVTDDVDAWYRRLCEADVPTRAAPAHNETYNIYNFFAEDPDGHLIEFQRFLDPGWPAPGHDSEAGENQ